MALDHSRLGLENLLIEKSTRVITCIAIRLRDLYERLMSEKENKLWITVLFSELQEKYSSYHQSKFQILALISVGYSR